MPAIALLLIMLLTLPAAAELTLDDVRALAARTRLASASSYLNSARRARAVWTQQGGLVQLPRARATVILPDLHAQRDYLLQALQLRVNGQTVWQGLSQGRLNLLCLGDGMHAEGRAQARWLQAEREFLGGLAAAPALDGEMLESLGLMQMVMELKSRFPVGFYFVRGNHEDIDPQRPYAKFTRVGESRLVREWTLSRFGIKFLKEWHGAEQSLPLVAEAASFVASHAAPDTPLSRQAVQKRERTAFTACCWSDNTTWLAGGTQEQGFLENARRFGVTPERPWICGHRKVVDALYRSQCGGRLIQINPLDSEARVWILAPPAGQAFRASRDVRRL